MKTCIKCHVTKPTEAFHKHKGMRDGRLNKCASCVKEDVDEWRKNNPDCRKREHQRVRVKKGIKTREQWLSDLVASSIGRKASSAKYAHKRHSRVKVTDELTNFVVEEAAKLCELRKTVTGFDWHIDHIVPLNHKKACGLHIANNLQVVPASWNVEKGNRNMNPYWDRHD